MTLFKFTALAVMGWLLLAPAAHAQSVLVEKASRHSVSATADKLAALAKDEGLTVYARIDHKAEAKKAGRMMTPSEVLLLGSPTSAARVAWHDPRAMLDLPVRVLIYQDASDETRLVYRRPTALNNEFATSQCATIPEIETRIGELTDMAVK